MIMNFFIFWVLSVMVAAAESSNSTSSVQATTTSKAATTLDWVKITAVPLGVFLIGACIWGIIADTTASWRSSVDEPEGGPPEAEEVPSHCRHINNASDARDPEEGLELSHHGMEDSLAMAPNPPVERDGMDDAA